MKSINEIFGIEINLRFKEPKKPRHRAVTMTKSEDSQPKTRRYNLKPAYQMVLGRLPTRSDHPRSLADRWRYRCHSYGRWATQCSRRVMTRIRMYEPPSASEVITQANVLCRDFIYHRLKRQNLLSLKLELHPSSVRSSEIALEIETLAGELERQYPHLYHNICRQINTVMSSEALARNTFNNIADAMLSGSHVTWGRVVALFLIAASLSAECVQQGHPEYVRAVVDVFTDVTRRYLAAWIVLQGGWNDITRVFRTTKEASTLWAVTGIGAILGFCVTLATSLVL